MVEEETRVYVRLFLERKREGNGPRRRKWEKNG